MSMRRMVLCMVTWAIFALGVCGQTEKTLTNSDVLEMTKQGFDAGLIVKAIQTGRSDFDVSTQALVDLKSAGVSQIVLEAMLTAHSDKPSAVVEAGHGAAAPADAGGSEPAKTGCRPNGGCLLKEGIEVPLKFGVSVTSKTANVGDRVEFILDSDLKVVDSVVVPKGAHAVATVSNAKKAGMMGKGGELSVQLEYLVAEGSHVRLRGTKGREGEGKVGATVALTVLFGPIGLIKHGKNVEIPEGTPLVAYVDQDVWLAPVK